MKKNIKVILLFITLASFCVVSFCCFNIGQSWQKVLILEANDYIGGRMKTQKVPLL